MSGEFVLTAEPDETVRGWHRQAVLGSAVGPANALTIDVEDYFQVEAFSRLINRRSWDRFECRVERNVDQILDMLDMNGSSATFFTLGWIADRHPHLVRKIVSRGHELASHGSNHEMITRQSARDFAADIERAKKILEDRSGHEVKGYRAPSFSILKGNLWALDEIRKAGYRYSSSIYPILHDNYGIPDAPRFAFHPFKDHPFIEIPVTSIRFAGRNWPCGGGGFFRLMPYRLSAAALRYVNRREQKPCIFYFHPWEIDPTQPRIAGASFKSQFRHYLNLHKMAPRLSRLLASFNWRRMDEIFLPPAPAARP